MAVMDSREARAVLSEHLRRYRTMSHGDLQRLLVETDVVESHGASGAAYQIEIHAVWDRDPGGNLRVLGHVDDGGLRAFVPLSQDFVMAPDGSFIGE
jgi:hypothetical protein